MNSGSDHFAIREVDFLVFLGDVLPSNPPNLGSNNKYKVLVINRRGGRKQFLDCEPFTVGKVKYKMDGIDPQKALHAIAKMAPNFAHAKANRIYMEQFRKTIKATLMKKAELEGHKSAVNQEREAYADPSYQQHLEALREAVQIEEELRWKLVAAEAAIEVWRSQESTNRMMDRC